MKTLILLTSIILLGACAAIPTLKDQLVGSYERKIQGKTHRVVLMGNSKAENYVNGVKEEGKSIWFKKEEEIHVAKGVKSIGGKTKITKGIDIYITWENGSLMHTATIDTDLKIISGISILDNKRIYKKIK